jgi:hypothetical protein
MSTHGKEHWTIVKRVFKYLCGMKHYDICYQGRLGGDNGKLMYMVCRRRLGWRFGSMEVDQ